MQIPCSGSLLWRASEMFGREALTQAGDGGYVLVRGGWRLYTVYEWRKRAKRRATNIEKTGK